MTNFEKITESPETLAEELLLIGLCDYCAFKEVEYCSFKNLDCIDGIAKWLNEESEVEQ